MEDNKRIFTDFGPNSGLKFLNKDKMVRHDLSLWYKERHKIAKNNELISSHIREFIDVIPDEVKHFFEGWLSHIDAFKHHLEDDNVDYREHQFPIAVVDILRSNN